MMLPTFREVLTGRLRLLGLSDPMISPSYLIDSLDNLKTKDVFGLPAGSLFLSVVNVFYGFAATGNAWHPRTDRDFEDYLESFIPLLNIHNPYELDSKTKQQKYGRDVLSCSRNYSPRPAGCVVQSGAMCL